MNKKIILILMVLLLVGSVTAYTIGQTVTQEQFDNQTFDSISKLNPSQTNQYLDRSRQRVFTEFTYDSLRWNDKNQVWVIVKVQDFVTYHLNEWRSCRDTNTVDECKVIALQTIRERGKSKLNDELAWLKKQQTQDFDEMENILGDIFAE